MELAEGEELELDLEGEDREELGLDFAVEDRVELGLDFAVGDWAEVEMAEMETARYSHKPLEGAEGSRVGRTPHRERGRPIRKLSF